MVQFTLDAGTVPERKDLNGIVLGDWAIVHETIALERPTDVITQAVFTAKQSSDDLDDAATAVQKSITTVSSAAGVIIVDANPANPAVAEFILDPNDTKKFNGHRYDMQVSITRGGATYYRAVCLGRLRTVQGLTGSGGGAPAPPPPPSALAYTLDFNLLNAAERFNGGRVVPLNDPAAGPTASRYPLGTLHYLGGGGHQRGYYRRNTGKWGWLRESFMTGDDHTAAEIATNLVNCTFVEDLAVARDVPGMRWFLCTVTNPALEARLEMIQGYGIPPFDVPDEAAQFGHIAIRTKAVGGQIGKVARLDFVRADGGFDYHDPAAVMATAAINFTAAEQEHVLEEKVVSLRVNVYETVVVTPGANAVTQFYVGYRGLTFCPIWDRNPGWQAGAVDDRFGWLVENGTINAWWANTARGDAKAVGGAASAVTARVAPDDGQWIAATRMFRATMPIDSALRTRNDADADRVKIAIYDQGDGGQDTYANHKVPPWRIWVGLYIEAGVGAMPANGALKLRITEKTSGVVHPLVDLVKDSTLFGSTAMRTPGTNGEIYSGVQAVNLALVDEYNLVNRKATGETMFLVEIVNKSGVALDFDYYCPFAIAEGSGGDVRNCGLRDSWVPNPPIVGATIKNGGGFTVIPDQSLLYTMHKGWYHQRYVYPFRVGDMVAKNMHLRTAAKRDLWQSGAPGSANLSWEAQFVPRADIGIVRMTLGMLGDNTHDGWRWKVDIPLGSAAFPAWQKIDIIAGWDWDANFFEMGLGLDGTDQIFWLTHGSDPFQADSAANPARAAYQADIAGSFPVTFTKDDHGNPFDLGHYFLGVLADRDWTGMPMAWITGIACGKTITPATFKASAQAHITARFGARGAAVL